MGSNSGGVAGSRPNGAETRAALLNHDLISVLQKPNQTHLKAFLVINLFVNVL